MTPNLWITVLIFVGTAAVSLSVAYMHRKQMRQIELFRKDAAAGLLPPPNPVTRFLRQYWWEMVLAVWALYDGVRWYIEESQHSYHTGVSAALTVWLLVNLGFSSLNRLISKYAKVIVMLMVETEMLLGMVSGLATDLKNAGQLSKETEQKISSEFKRLREFTRINPF